MVGLRCGQAQREVVGRMENVVERARLNGSYFSGNTDVFKQSLSRIPC